MTKKLTTEEFVEKAKRVHGNKYDYSVSVYTGTFNLIDIICKEHGVFKQKPNNHLNGQGCKLCGISRNKDKQKNAKFIENSQQIHGNKYDYSLVEYINNRTKIKLFCNDCKNIIEQTPTNNLKHGCPYCTLRILTLKKFIQKANKFHNNKYDYSKVNYKNTRTKITIICPVHGEFKQRVDHHLICGCPKCSKKYNYTNYEFINLANEIHNNLYDYSKTNYINAKTKIKIICRKHGEFVQTPSSHLSGKGCPNCRTSQGETIIEQILVSNNIKFSKQKSFPMCKNQKLLYFDFYLPEQNTCIEFDGEQHFKPIPHWGGKTNYNKIKKRDEIKNNYCKNNNILLIRIKFNDDINTILTDYGILRPENN